MSNVDDPLRVGSDAGPVLVRAISARQGGMCVAAVLAAIGLIFAWQASLIDFGDLALPGPGFFGAALLVLIARCSLVIAVLSAAIGMAACWYFFQVALGLQLPIGPF